MAALTMISLKCLLGGDIKDVYFSLPSDIVLVGKKDPKTCWLMNGVGNWDIQQPIDEVKKIIEKG